MDSSRDAFLNRVRQAVAAGNRAGGAAALEPRRQIGYQGAGADPLTRFCQELSAAGGQAHRVATVEQAVSKVIELVQVRSIERILLGPLSCLPGVDLAGRLRKLGLEVDCVEDQSAAGFRTAAFAADLGITGVDYLIAETGTLVTCTRSDNPRSPSLTSPVHLVVASRDQVLPDLFDLFARFAISSGPPLLPSCLTLITGPSKTGDIELRLVTGVHGPGEVLVVLVEG
jgi:L-lactate dehydrogenase complex protein LldG